MVPRDGVTEAATIKPLFKEEMAEVRQQMNDLRGKIPAEYENHGWIWLFLRKG